MARIAIIGAGHNGLVCACYLAKAGHDVHVFERTTFIGGGCRNEVWASGATISPAANHFGMFSPKVMQELALPRERLRVVPSDPSIIVGLNRSESIALYNSTQATKDEIARFCPKDCEGYDAFSNDIGIVRHIMSDFAHDPYATAEGFSDALDQVKSGLSHKFLSSDVVSTISSYFSDPNVQAAFVATTSLYNSSPIMPGTAFALAYLSLFEVDGVPGWGVPIGGMGILPKLLAETAEGFGVKILLDSPVERIVVENGIATGVLLETGEFFQCDIVASNADPYTTYVTLGRQPEASFAAWKHKEFVGPCAKFNFTFRGSVKPRFISPHHISLLHQSLYAYMPSTGFLDRAYNDAWSLGYSQAPYVEFICPSDFDHSLAPRGLRTGSIYIMYSNYNYVANLDILQRRALKQKLFENSLALLGIDDVHEVELLDPVDIEKKFAFYLGNVDHGSQTLENIFEKRGRLLEGSIPTLYICGSGAHPGGLVSGIPGRNAAMQILERL